MNDDAEFLDGLVPLAPLPDLRERVLMAAAAALAREPRGRWTRIWESRRLRISWAAAVALLAAANLLVPVRRTRGGAPVSAARMRPDRESGAALQVPKIDPDAPAWSVLDEEKLLDRLERPTRRPPTVSSKEKSS